MSEPKQHAPARRHLRRFIFGLLLAFVLLCSIPIYLQFFSPSQRLWRELSAYKLSLDRENPRPDFVPHLTSNAIPYLLDWIETKDYPSSWKQSLARRVTPLSDSLASKLREWDSSFYQHYPPSLTVVGFDFLGSEASAALPALRQLVLRSDAFDEATMAIIAIGPQAVPITSDFAHHPQPRIRRTAAYVLGALRSKSAESSAILLKLIDDPDEGVRHEAYNALAEFPSAHNESVLIPRLANEEPEVFFDVAYSLHSGSTNALLHMLNLARDSTDRTIHAAVFGALALRDDLQRIESLGERRNTLYQKKRLVFNQMALEAGVRIASAPPDKLHLDVIRSNILAAGLPHVHKTLGPPNPFIPLRSVLKPMNTKH
jgi:hypothetical protein